MHNLLARVNESMRRRMASQPLLGLYCALFFVIAWYIWNNWSRAPLLAIIFAGGIGIIGIIRFPKIGLWICSFSITALPTLILWQLPTAILIVTLCALMFQKLLHGEISWCIPRFVVWSGLLFAWWLVTLIWTPTYAYWRFAFHFFPFLIMIVFSEMVKSRDDFFSVLIAAALGILFTAITVAYSMVTTLATGISNMAGAVVGKEEARFFGLWNNANALAYSLMPFVAMMTVSMRYASRRIFRVLFAAAALSGFVCIMLTLTRGAMLCTIIMFVILISTMKKRWYLLSVLSVAMIVAVFVAPSNLLNRVSSLSHGFSDASVSERSKMLDAGWEMAERSFPFGQGIGTSVAFSADYAVHRMSNLQLHNSYIDVIVETGLIGIILLVGMVFSLFNAVAQKYYHGFHLPERESLRLAFRAGLIAVLLGMTFEDVIGFPSYWLFFTLLSIFPYLSYSNHTKSYVSSD